MAEIVPSNRGGEKLCLDGYMYNKRRISSTRIKWLCSQRGAFGCKGSLATNNDIQVLKTVEHNHPPNPVAITLHKLRTAMKEAAQTSSKPSGEVFNAIYDAADVCSKEVLKKQKDTLKRSLRRHKSEANLSHDIASFVQVMSALPLEITLSTPEPPDATVSMSPNNTIQQSESGRGNSRKNPRQEVALPITSEETSPSPTSEASQHPSVNS